MLAEIPPGAQTGLHKHGEEAIFILSGSGFSVIDGVRYDWKEHSAVLIPFGADHQHFNTSDTTVRYLAVLAVHLEHFVGLHRTIQIEPKGTTTSEPDVPVSNDGMNPEGTDRVVLNKEDAIDFKTDDKNDAAIAAATQKLPEFDPEHPLVVGDVDGMHELPAGIHKAQTVQYMRINKDINKFHPKEVEISGLLIDPPREAGGTHAHMEAHLYVVQGSGYTTIGDEKVPWKAGTALQVPGPQTPHQHVNESDEEAIMVRMAFGIRYFFEQIAKREFPYLYLAPRAGVLEKSASASSR